MAARALLRLASQLLLLALALPCVHEGSPLSSGRPCHVPGEPPNRSSCCGEENPHECYSGCCLACNGPVMDPGSRCVAKNGSHSTCPPAAPPPPPPPPPRPCTEENLASGIRLPCPWPPRLNMTRETITPHYLTAPPATINIDDGRQLFIVSSQATSQPVARLHYGCLSDWTDYL